MKVTVKMFASFREATGEPQLTEYIEPGLTVGQLWARLVAQHPKLAPLQSTAGMALNSRYVPPETALSDGDIVAFLPPVSGG